MHMNRTHMMMIGALLVGAALGGGGVAWAKNAGGEPVTIRFENEFVRVFEARLPPGGKVPMHDHPARVTRSLAPYKMKFTYPDGTSKILDRKGGEVAWHEGTSHAAENIGTTEFHVMGVEVKCVELARQLAKEKAAAPSAPAPAPAPK